MKEDRSSEPSYEMVWDDYVTHTYPALKDRRNARKSGAQIEWPGDEWGDDGEVDTLFDRSFPKLDPDGAHHFLEIGSGAGRYTVKALRSFPAARVHAFDVSSAFLASLEERLARHDLAGRATLIRLGPDPDQLPRDIEAAGLTRKIDVLFSYDAMVHVDLQTLVVYFVSAALILRPGGTLMMNVADATSPAGTDRLMRSARRIFSEGGRASTRFIWHSPQVFETLLPQLGFELQLDNTNDRDLYITARLTDPQKGVAQAKAYGWDL